MLPLRTVRVKGQVARQPWRNVGIPFLAVVLAVQIGSIASAHADSSDAHRGATGASWAQYLPSTTGSACTSAASSTLFGSTTSATQVVTVAGVDKSSKSRTITLHVASGDGPQDVTYTIGADGSLQTPGIDQSAGSTHVTSAGFVIYPPIPTVLKGKDSEGQVTVKAESAELPAGSASYTMRYRAHPVFSSDPIVTPAGAFRDVVGLDVTMTAVDSDLSDGGSVGARVVLQFMSGLLSTTVWFARGIGPVLVVTALGRVELAGCTRPDGSPARLRTVPTPKSQHNARLCAKFQAFADLQGAATPKSSAGDWDSQKATAMDGLAKVIGVTRQLRRSAPPGLDRDVATMVRAFKRLNKFVATSSDEDEVATALLRDEANAQAGLATRRVFEYGKAHCGIDLSATSTDTPGSDGSGTEEQSGHSGNPAGGPVLGAEWGSDQEGYGTARPATVFNGGDPTGLVSDISWDSWEGSRVTGHGTAVYVTADQTVADGTDEPATIVAFDLGDCNGRQAYRAVEWFFPQHGESFKPDQYINACTGDYVGS